MSSYYRTIDGRRYDANLLEMAEGLMEGQRDGRLSREDAEQLWESAFDGMGMTAVEMATLAYIREHENPTRPAKEYFDDLGVGRLPDDNDALRQCGITASERGLEEMRVMRVYPEEVKLQSELEGSVSFAQAFAAALDAILRPGTDGEVPFAVLCQTEADALGAADEDTKLDRLREHCNLGTLFLVPLDTPPNKDAAEDYYPPENGESVKENWIFNLLLDELSDHLYWAVVPRDGSTARVYGTQ